MVIQYIKKGTLRISTTTGAIWIILATGIAVRGTMFFLHFGHGVQDADEALVGLMAKHIAEGSAFPLIWYGQNYMGTFTSWLTAPVFLITGISGDAVRVVPLLFSICLPYLVYKFTSEVFGKQEGLISALWIAICPPFLAVFSLKYTCAQITLTLGLGVWLLAYRIWRLPHDSPQKITRRFAILGGLIGLGLWVHLMSILYAIATIGFLLLYARKKFSIINMCVFTGCFLLGSSPLLIDALLHKGQSLIFIIDIFRQPSQQAEFTIGTGLYNALAVCFPILLGGGPIWSFYWISFSWKLHPLLESFVGINVLMLLNVLFVGIAGYAVWDRNILANETKSFKKWLIVIGIPILLLLITSWGLFGQYLWEMHRVLSAGVLTWSQFEGGFLFTPTFLLQELFSPAMFIYVPYILALLYSLWTVRRKRRGHEGTSMVLLLLCLVIGSYVGTSYGIIRSPRYLMPIYTIAPILFANFIRALAQRSKWVAGLLTGIILVGHATGLLSIPPSYYLQPLHYVNWWNPDQSQLVPPSNTPLIEFLHSSQIVHVYAKYWLGIPIIFDSQETIVTSTGVPGRYPLYDEHVTQAERVAYIFHRSSFESQGFERIIRNAGISYKKTQITEYVVYYDVALSDRLNSPLWPSIVKLFQYP